MSTYAAPIEVYRAAFPLVGAVAPESVGAADPVTLAAGQMYEGIVKMALTRHAWTFAEKIALLTYEGEATDHEYIHRYTLPSDILLPRYVTLANAPFKEFDLRGNSLFTIVETATDLRLGYTWRVPESRWPADFADAIVHILAGRVARGPLSRQADGERYEALGESKLLSAKARDRSTHRGPQRQRDPALVRVWRGAANPSVPGEKWRALPDAAN